VQVERQHLGDQGGADVGAEHHRERGRRLDQAAPGERGHHEGGGGAALQDAGDPDASEQRGEPIGERDPQQMPQLGAERALHTRAHHARAP
jgi:hypothetical protein